MNIYVTKECCSVFAHLDQLRSESIYEYFERFQGYLEDYPNHGLQLHELLKHFLNGMIMKEQYILDTIAGGSIWNRTPTEVLFIIQERAAETRQYMEYVKFSHEEKVCQEAEAEYQRIRAEYYKESEEFSRADDEAKSAFEPVQYSSNNEEVVRCSSKRSDIHSRGVCDLGTTRRLMKLYPNWKRRKLGKYIITNAEFSMFSPHAQENRALFGWKPGWKLWQRALHKVTRKGKGNVRKFDGVHPWAPNIG